MSLSKCVNCWNDELCVQLVPLTAWLPNLPNLTAAEALAYVFRHQENRQGRSQFVRNLNKPWALICEPCLLLVEGCFQHEQRLTQASRKKKRVKRANQTVKQLLEKRRTQGTVGRCSSSASATSASTSFGGVSLSSSSSYGGRELIPHDVVMKSLTASNDDAQGWNEGPTDAPMKKKPLIIVEVDKRAAENAKMKMMPVLKMMPSLAQMLQIQPSSHSAGINNSFSSVNVVGERNSDLLTNVSMAGNSGNGHPTQGNSKSKDMRKAIARRNNASAAEGESGSRKARAAKVEDHNQVTLSEEDKVFVVPDYGPGPGYVKYVPAVSVESMPYKYDCPMCPELFKWASEKMLHIHYEHTHSDADRPCQQECNLDRCGLFNNFY